MRGMGLLLMVPAVMATQERNVSPLIRGTLVARDSRAAGEFSVRAADEQVFRYRFDAKTYVERDQHLINVARLDPGEKVEVLSDEGPASAVRYARTVHVMNPPPPTRPLTQGRLRADRDTASHFAALSNLTFSGVVVALEGGRLTLHTRNSGDQVILLRQDTRFLENGEIVEPSVLHPSMRIFVRAGRNLDNETEAFEVVWGEILTPK